MAWLVICSALAVIVGVFTVGRKKTSQGVPGLPVTVAPIILPNQPTMEPKAQAVYDAARALMGQKIYNLLDPSIPAAEGCAASLSYVLMKAGYTIPPEGYPTVEGIISFVSSPLFEKVDTPVPGSIIVAHNPDPAVTTYAHAGVVMAYGICSNTSFPLPGFEAGTWSENYRSVALWEKAFSTGGSDTSFYTPV